MLLMMVNSRNIPCREHHRQMMMPNALIGCSFNGVSRFLMSTPVRP